MTRAEIENLLAAIDNATDVVPVGREYSQSMYRLINAAPTALRWLLDENARLEAELALDGTINRNEKGRL